MLRRFNVKNFMSFSCTKDGLSEEFSMIPGKVRKMNNHLYEDNDTKLLKFGAIYGANASGKSNLIKAISCMKKILMTNSSSEFMNKYSRIGEGNDTKPSYFEMEIVLDGKRYSYGFEVILNQSRFISEWLIELVSDDKEKIIFERDIENHKNSINDDWNGELRSRLLIYLEDAESSLFLHTINQQKITFYENYSEADILQRIYQWFEKSLNINEPNKPIYGYSFVTNMDNINNAIKIIKNFGTGINGVKIKNVPLQEILQNLSYETRIQVQREIDKILLMLKKQEIIIEKFYHLFKSIEVEDTNLFESLLLEELLRTKKITKNDYLILTQNYQKICIAIRTQNEFYIIHNTEKEKPEIETLAIKLIHSDDNTFDFGEESDGTQRLWDLLEVLLTDEDATFVIDEIDRCLHPCLTHQFIKSFFELSEKKNIQLIVTTHESRLLDFNLLRRDEIWFVDKRESGESDIYSLEEYNERFDKKIDKAYLEGRYGGVPIFTSLFSIEEEK